MNFIQFPEKIEQVIIDLKTKLPPTEYVVLNSVSIRDSGVKPDIAIYSGMQCIAVIDITSIIPEKVEDWKMDFQNIRDIATHLNAKYAVLSDGSIYGYYDTSKSKKIGLDVDAFCQQVQELLEFAEPITNIVKLCHDLASQLKSKLTSPETEDTECSFNKNGITKEIVDFFSELKKADFEPDKKSHEVSFTTQKEKELFDLLLPEYTDYGNKGIDGKVLLCRYTSLESLFYSLSNHTFRLNALAGMNDKGERTFLYKGLYRYDVDPDKLKEDNVTFIMSCSDINKKDRLEMWRLYADDAKGVCITFAVNEEELKKNFILRPILYDRDIDNRMTERYEILIGLIRNLKEQGVNFRLRSFELWKTFVKSGDYAYEDEVRLYYKETKKAESHSSKDWVITDRNHIINPFVSFYFCEEDIEKAKNGGDEVIPFPLILKEITLGPKCPEQEENRQQIFALIKKDPELSKLGLKDEDIKVSTIQNYR